MANRAQTTRKLAAASVMLTEAAATAPSIKNVMDVRVCRGRRVTFSYNAPTGTAPAHEPRYRRPLTTNLGELIRRAYASTVS